MGYTLHYQATGPHPLDDDVLERLNAHASEVTDGLSETAEDFSWRVDDGGTKVWGWTKPGLDMMDMEMDVDTITAAMSTVAELLPGWKVTLTDDFDSELYP